MLKNKTRKLQALTIWLDEGTTLLDQNQGKTAKLVDLIRSLIPSLFFNMVGKKLFCNGMEWSEKEETRVPTPIGEATNY